jgi:hypothetical protein
MNRSVLLRVLCYLSFGILPIPATADTLLGDVISGSYSYPCATCTYTGNFSYFYNPFVVDGGTGAVETTLFLGNPVFYSAWTVDFGANSLTLTMAPAPLTNASYSPDPFNGPVFTVLSGNSFGSVIGIHPNLHCTPCNPITAFVSGDSLYINWEGAGGNVGDTIELDFSVGGPVSSVPAPVVGAGLPGLITACIGLLAWWGRRQRTGGLVGDHPVRAPTVAWISPPAVT